MVSRRYRANRSVGNKLNSLSDKISRQQKNKKSESVAPQVVSDESIVDGTITDASLRDRAVTRGKIARGAVTTENLGTVNTINSDNELVFNIGPDGHLVLSGEKYETPFDGINSAVGIYTLAFDPDKNQVKIVAATPPAPEGLQLDTTNSTGSTRPGLLAWNTAENGPEIQLAGGAVNLQIGQEEVVRVVNGDTVTLTEGMVVYASGSQGQRLLVKRADYSSDTTSAAILGVVTHGGGIAENAEGFVTVSGLVHSLSNVRTADGWADGDVLWLSATGGWQKTKPVAPKHMVQVGYVVKASNGDAGTIYVHPQNGYELDELHNVKVTTPAVGEVLAYTQSGSDYFWANTAISTTDPTALQYVSGYFYDTASMSVNYSSTSKITGYINVYPWVVESTITVDTLNMYVGVAANITTRLAVYDSQGEGGLPGVAVINPGTTISMNSTGVRSYTGLATTLSPGVYWVASQYSGTTALTMYEYSSASGLTSLSMGGSTATNAFTGGTTPTSYRTAYTYGAFPSDLGTTVSPSGWSKNLTAVPRVVVGVL